MTVRTVSRYEQDQTKIVDAVNQLASGRTNATGTVTLSTGATSTTVSAPTCGAGSGVWLFPASVTAGTSASINAYVPSTDVTKGQFIVHHSSSTSTSRIFYYWVAG